MKSCNFIKISKAQKLKNSCCPSINKILYYFAQLGFGIVEFNDRPIIEKEKKKGGGGGGGRSVLENGRKNPESEVHCPGFV